MMTQQDVLQQMPNSCPVIPGDMLAKWQTALDLLGEVLHVPVALITRCIPPHLEIMLVGRSDDNPFQPGDLAELSTGLYCETVMTQRQELIIPNALHLPEWWDNPDIELGLISYCGFPLEWPDGEIFGTICVLDRAEHPYSNQAIELMRSFKDRVEGDITLLHHLDSLKRLNEKVQLLSHIPDNDPNIIILMACPGTIIYANPAAMAWLAHNQLEYPEGLYYILPKNFSQSACQSCSREEVKQIEINFKGQTFDFKQKPFREFDQCLITLTDVTEFKRISQERELYFEAFQHSLNAMVITDTSGRIQLVNPAFEKLYGFTQTEARGKNPRILNPGRQAYRDVGISADEYDALFGMMWSMISNPEIGFWEGYIPNKKKDGTLVWVHLMINAILNAAGEITHYLGIPIDITESRNHERKIRLEMYQAIAQLAEKRDSETGKHLIRGSIYCRKIAEYLGMPKKYCDDIETFSQLHDIGKVGIPDSILLAPRGLSDEEFEIMKRHTMLGYEILRNKPTLEMAADIAYCHHERYDGSGYPQGLQGEDIPLAARIAALADVYDALRCFRIYKEAWPHQKAMQEIIAGAGSHFDPAIVDAFSHLEQEFEKISVELQD